VVIQKLIKAIQYGNKNNALSIAFTGFSGGKLGDIVDIPMIIPIDDMQKIEDGHLILTHMIMQVLNIRLGNV